MYSRSLIQRSHEQVVYEWELNIKPLKKRPNFTKVFVSIIPMHIFKTSNFECNLYGNKLQLMP